MLLLVLFDYYASAGLQPKNSAPEEAAWCLQQPCSSDIGVLTLVCRKEGKFITLLLILPFVRAEKCCSGSQEGSLEVPLYLQCLHGSEALGLVLCSLIYHIARHVESSALAALVPQSVLYLGSCSGFFFFFPLVCLLKHYISVKLVMSL